ncbi:MAG: DNA-processing protein DprA [Anaerococcus sp.]|nr:DNA-processing protein DprA [Anaerococcus sp.]MDY2918481.1 DNA-processing protein DprA [Anaerococcus sp.]
MNLKMTKEEVILYLNFIYLNNSLILKIYDATGFDDFFEGDRKFYDFLTDKQYEKIFSDTNIEAFKSYYDKVKRYGYDYVTFLDEDYPINLRNIDDRPAILYYKGRLDSLADKNSLAFVGSRKCTPYGRWVTKTLCTDIASYGLTTVSGLAYGIDAACHRETLDRGKRTIGVIGCGIDKIYPKQNKDLYQAMEEKGLILSEFPLGTEPVAYNFPRRNRIISGISLGTVVVEAKEKSGTMITTKCALEQGREVFAVPGNINSIYSKGTNKLIQEGAKLVLRAEDIIEELDYLIEKIEEKRTLDLSGLDKDEGLVVRYIKEYPSIGVDKLVDLTNKPVEEINYLLTSLELKDYIENIGNDEFTIKE